MICLGTVKIFLYVSADFCTCLITGSVVKVEQCEGQSAECQVQELNRQTIKCVFFSANVYALLLNKTLCGERKKQKSPVLMRAGHFLPGRAERKLRSLCVSFII
ncbi:hypothetical protein ILYODFUR_015293 [Ilyodon furcidens]|uniref:Secreted protein n=1 Tax=Ilyodon furcidens TaxID=33524 RepID=A0ABV0UTJ0_9TELE